MSNLAFFIIALRMYWMANFTYKRHYIDINITAEIQNLADDQCAKITIIITHQSFNTFNILENVIFLKKKIGIIRCQ